MKALLVLFFSVVAIQTYAQKNHKPCIIRLHDGTELAGYFEYQHKDKTPDRKLSAFGELANKFKLFNENIRFKDTQESTSYTNYTAEEIECVIFSYKDGSRHVFKPLFLAYLERDGSLAKEDNRTWLSYLKSGKYELFGYRKYIPAGYGPNNSFYPPSQIYYYSLYDKTSDYALFPLEIFTLRDAMDANKAMSIVLNEIKLLTKDCSGFAAYLDEEFPLPMSKKQKKMLNKKLKAYRKEMFKMNKNSTRTLRNFYLQLTTHAYLLSFYENYNCE